MPLELISVDYVKLEQGSGDNKLNLWFILGFTGRCESIFQSRAMLLTKFQLILNWMFPLKRTRCDTNDETFNGFDEVLSDYEAG